MQFCNIMQNHMLTSLKLLRELILFLSCFFFFFFLQPTWILNAWMLCFFFFFLLFFLLLDWLPQICMVIMMGNVHHCVEYITLTISSVGPLEVCIATAPSILRHHSHISFVIGVEGCRGGRSTMLLNCSALKSMKGYHRMKHWVKNVVYKQWFVLLKGDFFKQICINVGSIDWVLYWSPEWNGSFAASRKHT